jgi:hypothetical protein
MTRAEHVIRWTCIGAAIFVALLLIAEHFNGGPL